jgi:predicted nucleotidyltransferase
MRWAFYSFFDDRPEYQLILFGSRATGETHERSDYDFGILGPKRLSLKDYFVINRVAEAQPYPVDLVDFQAVSQDFREYALQNYIVIPKP